MQKIILLLSLFYFLIIATSCKHEPDFDSLPAVSFSDDIQPIIAGNCAMTGCHGDRSGGNSGGDDDDDDLFPLKTYQDVMEEGEIVAGNAHKSELYQAVTNRGEELMPPPPRPMLSDDQIKLIYVWIEQGAKDN